MRKWYLILIYLFVLLLNWKVLRIKFRNLRRKKLNCNIISFKDNKLLVKVTICLILTVVSTILLYNITEHSEIIIFAGITIIATDGYGYPIYNNVIYPSAIYYNGVTYVVYQGTSDLDPYAMTYTHSTNTWSAAVKIADNPLTADDHGAPIIAIDNNQILHVFYGFHNTDLKHATSDSAEDISAWTVQADLDTDATYPTIINFDDTMYLFYRSGGGARTWVYQKSTDNGASWSGEYTIIDLDTDGSVGTYAYICDAYDSVNGRIHMTWSFRQATTPYPNHEIYHAYLNLSDGKMYDMAGNDLGTTITKAEADSNCKIVSVPTNGTSHNTIHLDSSGNPYIMWCQSQDMPETTWDGHFIYWTGAAWSSDISIITGLSQAFHSDFIVTSATNIQGYFGVEREGTYNDVEGWKWEGSTWTKINTIIQHAQTPNLLGYAKLVKDRDPSLKLLIAEFAVATNPSYLYANPTFRFETTLDFDIASVGESDDNYDIETVTNNPGIAADRAELCSIKGDAYDYASVGDCFKETRTYSPYRAALAGVSAGSTDKDTTTSDRRRISILSAAADTKYGVRSDLGYSGDFDFEEQINLITFPATNYTYGGIGYQVDSDNVVLITRARGSATNIIQTYQWTGGVLGTVFSYNTTDTEIWFRITRVGSLLKTYYKLNLGDGWTELGSWASAFTGEGSPLKFCENGGLKPDTVIEFSNWKLNSGTVGTGGHKSAGVLTTNIELLPDGQRISTMTIDFADVSATYTLTPQILKGSDSSVLWSGSAIVSGTTVTFDVSDLDTIGDDFKVEITWAGDGDDTAALINIYGEFENIPSYHGHGRHSLLIPLMSMICRVKRWCKC